MITKRQFVENCCQASLDTEIEITAISHDGSIVDMLRPKNVLYDQEQDRIIIVTKYPYKGKNSE